MWVSDALTVLPRDLKHHSTRSATVASAVAAAAITNITINKPAQQFTYLSEERWLSRKVITGTRSMGFLMSF